MTSTPRRLGIWLAPETLDAAREAATIEEMPLPEWLAKTVHDRAKLTIARAALADHFAEFGEPDPEAVKEVRAELEAVGFYEPETREQANARVRALARLDGLSEEI